MTRAGLAALAAVLVLAGCGTIRESRLNPVNWWGGSSSEAPSLAPRDGYPETIADTRPLVAQVVTMQIDRAPGGAIVRATGLPATQGWWAADLVAEVQTTGGHPVAENGVMSFQFRILPPPVGTRSGPQQSREVTAAVFLSDQELAGVRTITVKGRDNQRSSRR
jgi:hypothetical protein